MSTPISRIEFLLQRYADNNCTKKELLELFELIGEHSAEADLQIAMDKVWQNGAEGDVVPVINKDELFSRIVKQQPTIKKNWNWWQEWGKVAAVVFTVSIASAIYWVTNQKKEAPVAINVLTKADIPPGHNAAVLTLSNGKQVMLDSTGDGKLLKDQDVDIVKKGNEISYNGTTDKLVYNTISTNNGNQWQLRLPDGSKVWLNAASSISYPLSFTGNERRVEVTGEAYFEVVHNAKQPFKVNIKSPSGNGGTIEDVGTSFNVNAYGDEPVAKTTLLEGAVKLTIEGKKGVLLKPGQQAVVSNHTANTKVLDNIDTEDATAWKDGLFRFNDGNVETIMRQIGRWYNVTITYAGAVPDKQIYGTASRNTSLSSLLKVLSLSGIHLEVVGNKIIVKP